MTFRSFRQISASWGSELGAPEDRVFDQMLQSMWKGEFERTGIVFTTMIRPRSPDIGYPTLRRPSLSSKKTVTSEFQNNQLWEREISRLLFLRLLFEVDGLPDCRIGDRVKLEDDAFLDERRQVQFAIEEAIAGDSAKTRTALAKMVPSATLIGRKAAQADAFRHLSLVPSAAYPEAAARFLDSLATNLDGVVSLFEQKGERKPRFVVEWQHSVAGASGSPQGTIPSDGSRLTRGGRPIFLPWSEFAGELVRLANSPDGLPDHAELKEHMWAWCHVPGRFPKNGPSDSEFRKHLEIMTRKARDTAPAKPKR